MKACKNGLKKGNGAKMVKFVFNLIFENVVFRISGHFKADYENRLSNEY